MHDEVICTILNVRHVKWLKKNLLSLRQFDDNDCKERTEKRVMRLVKVALVVIKAKKNDVNLYILVGEMYMEIEASIALTSSKEDTTKSVVISGDVIFAEDKLQEQDVKYTLVNNSNTLMIQMEQKSKQQDYSETISEYKEQEPIEFETTEVRRSTCEKKTLAWQSDYIMEGNVAYCLLTKDDEPSAFREATTSSNGLLWMTKMQEEFKAHHKNNTWELVPLPQ
ncbi:hypothetical protein K1719_021864 [Acacia pycnantha]|nr:hypothetical protein K1719_021864 [Acacia pycnantha]